MEIVINSLEEMKHFAKQLAKCLRGNEVILLKGNLAAGKTTFTRFLVSALNPEIEDEVNSPTFTVMNQYDTQKFPIYHIDLYRVKDFDFTDFLGEGVIIVEWGTEETFDEIEDMPVLFIEIFPEEEEKRVLKIKQKNADYLIGCIRPQ